MQDLLLPYYQTSTTIMDLTTILTDKTLKPKEATEAIQQLLVTAAITPTELINHANTCKDPAKATCIEALEFATNNGAVAITPTDLEWIIDRLAEKAPRIKWESAKVVGNTIHLHPSLIEAATNQLLANTEHTGTVVRWSAAFAIGQILKLKTTINETLIPAATAIMEREEKNSIKKIYAAALKVVAKK
jgi:hypothetical protein